jgi:beta-galactosidase
MQKKEFYPWSHAFCGDIDICGWKRPQSYYRDVLWKNSDQPYIFVVPPEPSFDINPEKMSWSKWEWHDVVRSWNWEEFKGEDLEVHVYNPSQSIELFLNERSLGKKKTNRQNEWIAKWTVPFEPGVLKAINYNQSKPVSSDEIRTANHPVKIELVPDRMNLKADGQDLCYIAVELVDESGYRNPTITQMVEFEIMGAGSIIAVGSSNPMSIESYQKPYRNTYQGRCLVIIKSDKNPGIIQFKAKTADLPVADIIIRSL